MLVNICHHLNMNTPATEITPPLFYWSACVKPGKWAIMYMCVRGIYDFEWIFLFHFIYRWHYNFNSSQALRILVAIYRFGRLMRGCIGQVVVNNNWSLQWIFTYSLGSIKFMSCGVCHSLYITLQRKALQGGQSTDTITRHNHQTQNEDRQNKKAQHRKLNQWANMIPPTKSLFVWWCLTPLSTLFHHQTSMDSSLIKL